MTLVTFSQEMLPAIEDELKTCIAPAMEMGRGELYHMLAYHLGWEGEGAGSEATGKRIRPLLLLLTNAAAGGDWRKSLPAAAAVELIHNFSLIHDDIEDNSPLRRGRRTVWKIWGEPQAINTGDAMFVLAQMALLKMRANFSAGVTLQAAQIVHQACMSLTQGQHLDISFEDQKEIDLQAYTQMVEGKTAALIAACAELGALAAGCKKTVRCHYYHFGLFLGKAFQAQDDLLGIWGDSLLTGKSAESDLVSGKKTLPVLFALNQKGRFYQRWLQGPFQPEEVNEAAHLLEADGAHDYTQNMVKELTSQALNALNLAKPQGDAAKALILLAHFLLDRKL